LGEHEPIGTTLTLASAAQIMREAVKDKSYRATPLGLLVGRYLRWFRNEWGATASTIRDYEAILARMALTLADREPLEVTVEDLRDVIDLWADREARTRAKVTSVVRAFWAWAEEQDHVPFSPAAKLRRPRARRKSVPLLPLNTDARLLNATKVPRDRCAWLLLLDAGLRRSELKGLRVQDIDLSRRQITVYGKGQKSRVIPLRGRLVLELEHYMLEPLPYLKRPPEADDFLLYPEKRTEGGRILSTYPKRRMSGPTVHRWWYRHLQAAELVGGGMTSGLNMHRARHNFATDLRRVADLGAASQALGHSDLSTTASIYGHYDLSDLERAMEALAKAQRADEKEPAE
jgi:integrase/recombinase XerC